MMKRSGADERRSSDANASGGDNGARLAEPSHSDQPDQLWAGFAVLHDAVSGQRHDNVPLSFYFPPERYDRSRILHGCATKHDANGTAASAMHAMAESFGNAIHPSWEKSEGVREAVVEKLMCRPKQFQVDFNAAIRQQITTVLQGKQQQTLLREISSDGPPKVTRAHLRIDRFFEASSGASARRTTSYPVHVTIELCGKACLASAGDSSRIDRRWFASHKSLSCRHIRLYYTAEGVLDLVTIGRWKTTDPVRSDVAPAVTILSVRKNIDALRSWGAQVEEKILRVKETIVRAALADTGRKLLDAVAKTQKDPPARPMVEKRLAEKVRAEQALGDRLVDLVNYNGSDRDRSSRLLDRVRSAVPSSEVRESLREVTVEEAQDAVFHAHREYMRSATTGAQPVTSMQGTKNSKDWDSSTRESSKKERGNKKSKKRHREKEGKKCKSSKKSSKKKCKSKKGKKTKRKHNNSDSESEGGGVELPARVNCHI